MSVERVKIGCILHLERMPVEPSPDIAYAAIGVRSFGKGMFHHEPKLGSQLGSLRFFRLLPGRLVVSNIKGWEGAIAVSSAADGDCIASNRFLIYKANPDRADESYLRYYLLSEPGLRLINGASPGSADRNRTLAIDRFEQLEIPLPPIEEQRQIAAKLDYWSIQIKALRERLVSAAPDAITAILPKLIDHYLRTKITETWKVADLAEFVSDIVHPGDDLAAADCFVGLQHIESHTGRCVGSAALGSEKGRKFRFRPGDVIYAYLRPYLNKVWLADRHGLCSVDQYVLRPRSGVSGQGLAFALLSSTALTAAVTMTHSLQLPRLRSGLLAEIRVPVVPDPSAKLLDRLEQTRRSVIALAERRRHGLAVAGALLPAFLNQAFAGLQ
jgi:type I restriction enzyme, S subunit